VSQESTALFEQTTTPRGGDGVLRSAFHETIRVIRWHRRRMPTYPKTFSGSADAVTALCEVIWCSVTCISSVVHAAPSDVERAVPHAQLFGDSVYKARHKRRGWCPRNALELLVHGVRLGDFHKKSRATCGEVMLFRCMLLTLCC
jgi:hypothetical protein